MHASNTYSSIHACESHQVLVGYNITDPSNRYWIVRNSCESKYYSL